MSVFSHVQALRSTFLPQNTGRLTEAAATLLLLCEVERAGTLQTLVLMLAVLVNDGRCLAKQTAPHIAGGQQPPPGLPTASPRCGCRVFRTDAGIELGTGSSRVLGLAAQHLVPWRFGSSNDRRSEGSEPEPRFCSLMAFALQTRIGIRRTIASLSASPPKHAVPCHVITVVYTGRGILSQVEAS